MPRGGPRQLITVSITLCLLEFRIAVAGLAWKAEEGEQIVAIQASDIKWGQWIRVARNYQLRIGLKDRSRETFDGFVREVSQRLLNQLCYDRAIRRLAGP